MSSYFDENKSANPLYNAEFGLEKECLRVSQNGFLSHTPHPFGDNANIQRDFCENQTEFVTDVFGTPHDVCAHLAQLHRQAAATLSTLSTGKEYLWPFSNPPIVKGEDDIPVANFTGTQIGKSQYRKYLAEKYGKKKMLYSGIHLNFSFTQEALRKMYESSDGDSFDEFKNNLYFQLAKKLTLYAWFIVYLTAASPVADGSLFDDSAAGKDVVSEYSSLRCSCIGYWNDFTPILDYSSLSAYLDSIENYIKSGRLRSESELYYPIRLKPKGANSVDALRSGGINHVELRVLDLNPLSPIGIFEEDIEFIHLLIVYLMSLPSIDLTPALQSNAISNEKRAALYSTGTVDIAGEIVPAQDAADSVINKMEKHFEGDTAALKCIAAQKNKLLSPAEYRYADIVRGRFGKEYVRRGLELAKEHMNILLEGSA